MECTFKKYFSFWDSLSDEDRALLCANATEEHFERARPGINVLSLDNCRLRIIGAPSVLPLD